MAYPWLYRQVTWGLDVWLLRRPDYQEFRRQLVQRMGQKDTQKGVLAELCLSVRQALRSTDVSWRLLADIPAVPRLSGDRLLLGTTGPEGREVPRLHLTTEGELSVVVPTLEAPRVVMTIAARVDGYRFLSEEVLFVEDAAWIAARRIDALRTTHERCEVALREQEMQKLTTEAELRALRAQVNPHFLFNALNTIGYLIDTAPERATDTLKDLTSLMRGILRRMEGNFTTLGEEIDLIRSYLDIEQARFEERLSVRIDVPNELVQLQVPALVLQPLVENAVKHGIQPALNGGAIRVTARQVAEVPRHGLNGHTHAQLSLEISDTGVGVSAETLKTGRREGIGLANVEHRLQCLYGCRASLTIATEPGAGTTVELRLPLDDTSVESRVSVVSTGAEGRS
jgi:two-component system, LytTR family, sensor kinase